MLEKEEIKAAAGEGAKLIDVEHFVAAGDIDPVFYDKTYYLGAGDDGEDAYRLLRDALEKTGRVAIGRWVFHDREYLVAVRPLEDVLGLHTMRFHDEVVDGGRARPPEPSRNPTRPRAQDGGAARRHRSRRSSTRRPTRTPTASAVLEFIERKAKGEEIDALPEETEAQDPDDLMAALEASLGAGKR